jgi:hypothetical protein
MQILDQPEPIQAMALTPDYPPNCLSGKVNSMSLSAQMARSALNGNGGWNRVNTGIIILLKMKPGAVTGSSVPGITTQKTISTGIYMAFSHELRRITGYQQF